MTTWIAVILIALSAKTQAFAENGSVLTGLDVLVQTQFKELQGKRIGLITNQTGRSRDNKSNVDLFSQAQGVTLAAIFSPEHGFKGTTEEGQVSSDTFKLRDGRSIPIYSLYGSTLAPTAQMLEGLDALVFDIQDIGSRFYTYTATMGMAMEAAAKAHVDFYVLDRPDPINGTTVEGPVLAPGIRHLTAYFPIPVRHGLTAGEIARLHVALNQVKVNLHVVSMKGWKRKLWYDETGLPWINPSPNMPSLDSATLYPGIACLEYTNLSVGRGTPTPFLWIGAPWLNAQALLQRLNQAKLSGVSFRMQEFTPTKSIYEGQKCQGISMRILDRERIRPLRIFTQLVCALRDVHHKEFELHWEQTRRMVGTERFLKLYESGAGPRRLDKIFEQSARAFLKLRKAFLIY